jgi:WD40 repeat protein
MAVVTRRAAFTALFLTFFLASCAVQGTRALAPSPSRSPSAAAALPQPIPQPITRTSLAAQVAWMWTFTPDRRQSLIGVDPSGAVVAQLDDTIFTRESGISRSADGTTLFLTTPTEIRAYSALDGKAQRTYAKPSGAVVSTASSADGRWLAMLTSGPDSKVQVIDLRTGVSQTMPAAHDPNARLPGMGGQISSVVWGTLAFAPDSFRLYALIDWGGPPRVTSFSLANDKLTQIATAVDGVDGRQFPSCAGPAVATKVLPTDELVVFCHYDGAVTIFDLTKLTLARNGVVKPSQKNPFWLSPIFTPDGQLLYLHQWPDFGDEMQVIDLASRRHFGPVPTPTRLADPGPFSWLMPIAYAGGAASTQPISPDGLTLYSASDNGLLLLRVPDLKLMRTIGAGVKFGEVWVSGDGRTLYATSDNGKRLLVMRQDGTSKAVAPTGDIGGFVASERG